MRTMSPASAPGRSRLPHLADDYLPDVVYGANDGIITTFAVVSGVVGAALSETIILILGFANLVADGFSMGASNYLARRSSVAAVRESRRPAARRGLVTTASFVVVGAVPLVAYLAPLPDDWRYPAAIALTLGTLFLFGAARTLVTRAGWLRSGSEMLVVGAAAAAVAYGIGAFVARLTDGTV